MSYYTDMERAHRNGTAFESTDRLIIRHSWGTKPEQKTAEKSYNAEYYKKNKWRWADNKTNRSYDDKDDYNDDTKKDNIKNLSFDMSKLTDLDDLDKEEINKWNATVDANIAAVKKTVMDYISAHPEMSDEAKEKLLNQLAEKVKDANDNQRIDESEGGKKRMNELVEFRRTRDGAKKSESKASTKKTEEKKTEETKTEETKTESKSSASEEKKEETKTTRPTSGKTVQENKANDYTVESLKKDVKSATEELKTSAAKTEVGKWVNDFFKLNKKKKS